MLILFRWHELCQALAAERGHEDLARRQAPDRLHHFTPLLLYRFTKPKSGRDSLGRRVVTFLRGYYSGL